MTGLLSTEIRHFFPRNLTCFFFLKQLHEASAMYHTWGNRDRQRLNNLPPRHTASQRWSQNSNPDSRSIGPCHIAIILFSLIQEKRYGCRNPATHSWDSDANVYFTVLFALAWKLRYYPSLGLDFQTFSPHEPSSIDGLWYFICSEVEISKRKIIDFGIK